jgi:hypothetical protein
LQTYSYQHVPWGHLCSEQFWQLPVSLDEEDFWKRGHNDFQSIVHQTNIYP